MNTREIEVFNNAIDELEEDFERYPFDNYTSQEVCTIIRKHRRIEDDDNSKDKR